MPKEPKTRPTPASVAAFLEAVEPPQRREDGKALQALMQAVTGHAPVLWGPSIIGFGIYTQTYADGRKVDWCRIGFSPRKANLVVYLIDGYEKREDLLAKLGKHKIGKSCLYVTALSGVDQAVLKTMIEDSWAEMARRYPL